MDMNQIQAALAEIRDLAEVKHDAEGCESRQKDLWDAFIRHIASDGPPDLAEMAREVLKTLEIDFWPHMKNK